MQKGKRAVCAITVFLLVLFAICFVLGTISHCPPFNLIGKATKEQPYYFEDSSVRWSRISDFAVCEDKLYILFSDKGCMDCYNLDGTYLYSYAFDLGEKGKAELYVSNDLLYVKSRDLRFYRFQNGTFVDIFDVSAKELASVLDSLTTNKQQVGDVSYNLRGSSIWCETPPGSEIILSRPGWMAVFQGSLLLIAGGVAFVLSCIALYFSRKKVNSSCALLA